MSLSSRSLVFGLLLVLSLTGGPVVAADEAAPDAQPASIIDDVLRMMEGGVSSRAIVDWLSRKEGPIPALTPDQMIDLSSAGASDEIIEALTRLTGPSSAVAPVPVPAPAQTPPPPPAAYQPTETGDGKAGVLVSLKYKRPGDTGDENSMLWKLFVYIDGQPVTYSRSQSTFMDQTIETFVRLSPGKHVVRLLHESHVKKGKKGVIHESQACPDPILFEVGTGDGWRLELTYLEKTFAKGGSGPVTWALKKGAEPVAGRKSASKDITYWAPVCDDMEMNIPEGKKTPGWIKRKLDGCVNWASLSEGVTPWPERAEIVAALAEYDFKPPRD